MVENTWQCSECGFQARTRTALMAHLRMKHGWRREDAYVPPPQPPKNPMRNPKGILYQCPVCGMTTPHRSSVYRHLAEQHGL